MARTSKSLLPIRTTSEQPGEELPRKQRESAAEHDARDLALRPSFAVHEHKPTNDDGNERECPCQRSGERQGEIVRRALPRRLRERDGGEKEQRRERQHARASKR